MEIAPNLTHEQLSKMSMFVLQAIMEEWYKAQMNTFISNP